MRNFRTQVGIVGAGPAGLLLSQLLSRCGIDSIVVEARSRSHVESRIRAGVLESATADLLCEAGVGARLEREALIHGEVELRFGSGRHLFDLADLTGGRTVTVYGQHEVVKDLIAARLAAGGTILFETGAQSLHELRSGSPSIRCIHAGEPVEIACEAIAGCDGFHGICRPSIPADVLTIHEHVFPFGWLGILADAIPFSEHLIYARHDRGFALASMRSSTVSRLYLQCAQDESIENWPDERIWAELAARLGTSCDEALPTGAVLQKNVTALRAFVAEPMQHGRLYLAGDSAHIVPPTGAKGLNLAAADVRSLALALAAFYREGTTALLDAYSTTCLERIWKVQRFSWWMTSMLHRFPDASSFDQRRQLAELRYLADSRAAATTFAENYVGLPFRGAAVEKPWLAERPVVAAD